MKIDSSILSLCTLAWLATASAAQGPILDTNPLGPEPNASPPARVAGDLLVPIHTAAADEVGGAYGIWAAGRSYKVGFDGGMTFVPLLGPQAEGERVRWKTLSVRIGDEELLTGTKPEGRRATDFRYEYDHGRVVEAYDVRRDGLEQTFVVAERPEAIGDLVVAGGLSGSLLASPTGPSHAALSLLDEDGRAVVRYGAATAVDAAGNTYPMTTVVEDGRIQLRLPAAAVAAAAFPVTVDPLLSNIVLGTVDGIADVDVYRDHQESVATLWVCYSFAASATDRDVVLQRFDADFSTAGRTVFGDVTDRWSSAESRVTGVGNLNDGKTITVFTRDFSGNQRRVRWHRHDKTHLGMSTAVVSAPYGGAEEWRPDVSGSFADSRGSTALIVYQREPGQRVANSPQSQIYALEYDVIDGRTVDRFELGRAHPDLDNERPSVHRISGAAVQKYWVVAWQSFDNQATGPWRVRIAKHVAGDSTRSVTDTLPTPAGQHALAPVVGGHDTDFVVLSNERPFHGDKPMEPHGRRVVAQRVRWMLAVTAPSLPYPAALLSEAPNESLVAGDCEFDYGQDSHWAATVLDVSAGAEELRLSKLGYEGAATETQRLHRTAGWVPTRGALCFDYVETRFAVLFGVDNPAGSDPLFAAYLSFDRAAAPTTYGTPCALAIDPVHEGIQLVGSGSEVFSLRTSLANTPALLALSLGSSGLPLDFAGMPGCSLLVDTGALLLGTLPTRTSSSGDARLPLPVPSHLPPFDLHAQWFLAVPGVNPAGIAASKGLKVPYVR